MEGKSKSVVGSFLVGQVVSTVRYAFEEQNRTMTIGIFLGGVEKKCLGI